MTDDNTPIALLHRAVAAEFGIVIAAGTDHAARRLRRRIYNARRAADADEQLLGLSVLIRPGGEVWIVKRGRISRQPAPDYPSRPIAADEMPSRIQARGNARLGLLFIP